MDALRELIEEWIRVHDSSQADLAERSGVAQNVISRWLNRQVDGASAKNLKKVAPILGLSYEELLRRMGEITSDDVHHPEDQDERELIQRSEQFKTALRGIPRDFWAAVAEASIRLAELMPETSTPVTPPPDGTVTKPEPAGNRGQKDDDERLQVKSHELVLAGLLG